MKVLAWDTSSKVGCIVALEDQRLVAELTLNVDSTHSEQLLWGIHHVIDSARWCLEAVDAFGVGVGPGSFTGLRIGITTARTLAHALNKPLIGVSSLAALARPIALSLAQDGFHPDATVIAVTDACKGELFALWGEARSVVQCSSIPDLWHPQVEEQVIDPKRLVDHLLHSIHEKTIQTNTPASWILVGEGRTRYSEEWARLRAVGGELKVSFPYSNQIQGRYVGLLAMEAISNSTTRSLSSDPLSIFPRYLRASDAEVKLKAGLLAPSPV